MIIFRPYTCGKWQLLLTLPTLLHLHLLHLKLLFKEVCHMLHLSAKDTLLISHGFASLLVCELTTFSNDCR